MPHHPTNYNYSDDPETRSFIRDTVFDPEKKALLIKTMLSDRSAIGEELTAALDALQHLTKVLIASMAPFGICHAPVCGDAN